MPDVTSDRRHRRDGKSSGTTHSRLTTSELAYTRARAPTIKQSRPASAQVLNHWPKSAITHSRHESSVSRAACLPWNALPGGACTHPFRSSFQLPEVTPPSLAPPALHPPRAQPPWDYAAPASRRQVCLQQNKPSRCTRRCCICREFFITAEEGSSRLEPPSPAPCLRRQS